MIWHSIRFRIGDYQASAIENETAVMTILIVEDDETVARVLGRVLTRQGYTVWQAANGASALELAETDHPRLVLLDLCLPDGDGVSLARRLKLRNPDLPIILMTAYPVRLRENPELTSSFLRILVKPLDLAELKQAVEASLSVCK
jgi:two-component system response regulator (stage 0 sporulation protein F)